MQTPRQIRKQCASSEDDKAEQAALLPKSPARFASAVAEHRRQRLERVQERKRAEELSFKRAVDLKRVCTRPIIP